jgi:RNA polymerase sigma factor for flagellar operon FliA
MRAEALVLLRDALNHELDPSNLVAHPRPGGAAARRRDRYFAAVASRHAARRSSPARVRMLAGGSADPVDDDRLLA